MKKIKELFHTKKRGFTPEEEKKLVEEIQAECEDRRSRLRTAHATLGAEKNALRAERRGDIDIKVREAFIYGNRVQMENNLKTLKSTYESLTQKKMPTSVSQIMSQTGPERIRSIDPDMMRSKFGYVIVYKKVHSFKYWKILEAKKVSEADSSETLIALTLMDLIKCPEEKKKNMESYGYKIISFLSSNPHETIVRYFHQFLFETNYYCFHEMYQIYLEKFIRLTSSASETRTSVWGYQLADAIHYLHSNGIAHRDISAKCLWLDSKMDIKLGGFSYASIIYDVKKRKMIQVKSIRKSVTEFHPPEESSSKPYDPTKSDIWMFASTLIFCLSQKYYPNKSNLIEFRVNNLPKGFSSDGQDLLSSCLQTDPSKRPTSSGLICHPFFKSFNQFLK